MRLIDADELEALFNEQVERGATDLFDAFDDALQDVQTVDAVPVVRCEDCKYWGDADGISENANGVRFARCKVHNHVVNGAHFGWCPRVNDFCSSGERRADDGTLDV